MPFAKLGKLKHKGALTTVHSRARNGGVTDQVLAYLAHAWGMQCDSTLDKDRYAKDI